MAQSIRSGQTAEMTIKELPERVFQAKVVRTARVMAADSRTLLVELEVDNSRRDILAGSYAQVRFTDMKMKAALTLPITRFRSERKGLGLASCTKTARSNCAL